MPSKRLLKDIINYALVMKKQIPGSVCRFHASKTSYTCTNLKKTIFFSGYVIVVVNAHLDYVSQIIKQVSDSIEHSLPYFSRFLSHF